MASSWVLLYVWLCRQRVTACYKPKFVILLFIYTLTIHTGPSTSNSRQTTNYFLHNINNSLTNQPSVSVIVYSLSQVILMSTQTPAMQSHLSSVSLHSNFPWSVVMIYSLSKKTSTYVNEALNQESQINYFLTSSLGVVHHHHHHLIRKAKHNVKYIEQ